MRKFFYSSDLSNKQELTLRTWFSAFEKDFRNILPKDRVNFYVSLACLKPLEKHLLSTKLIQLANFVCFQDLAYQNKHWHERCFLCAHCSVPLIDKLFGSNEDKLYCEVCYEELFGLKCDACAKPFKAGNINCFDHWKWKLTLHSAVLCSLSRKIGLNVFGFIRLQSLWLWVEFPDLSPWLNYMQILTLLLYQPCSSLSNLSRAFSFSLSVMIFFVSTSEESEEFICSGYFLYWPISIKLWSLARSISLSAWAQLVVHTTIVFYLESD